MKKKKKRKKVAAYARARIVKGKLFLVKIEKYGYGMIKRIKSEKSKKEVYGLGRAPFANMHEYKKISRMNFFDSIVVHDVFYDLNNGIYLPEDLLQFFPPTEKIIRPFLGRYFKIPISELAIET